MQKEKIIQAIADWIEENEGDLTACALPSEHKDEIAELIFAAAIAPHLEAGAEKCGQCNKNKACAAHICPYESEINDDEETLCVCCEDCRQECSDSI